MELSHLDLSLRVTEILEEVITCCRVEFGDVVDSLYLSGSRLEGNATRGSDIDLIGLLTDSAGSDTRTEIRATLERVQKEGDPEVGVLLLTSGQLAAGAPEYMRHSLPIMGDGKLAAFPSLSQTAAFRRWILGSLRIAAMIRGCSGGLTAPLSIPDTSPFGFPIEIGKEECPTKLFVNLVARMAGAWLILVHDVQPKSKSNSIDLYRDLAPEPFGPWVAHFYEALNRRWGYQIPESENEKAELAQLLQQLPDFENYFINLITPHLLTAGQSDQQQEREWYEACQKWVKIAS